VVRWDRFFEDLEDQLDSEWEAERLALDTEAERLRLSHVTLRERLTLLAGEQDAAAEPTLELRDGAVTTGRLAAVGADWVAMEVAGTRAGVLVVPLGAVRAVGLAHSDVLRTARPPASGRRVSLADRMGLGFVLRDAARRRAGVTLRLDGGRALTGTIDRAGADHLDIALHEPGSARRSSEVTGFRLVSFSAVVWVRLEDADLAFG
jgi:hypothetical protein